MTTQVLLKLSDNHEYPIMLYDSDGRSLVNGLARGTVCRIRNVNLNVTAEAKAGFVQWIDLQMQRMWHTTGQMVGQDYTNSVSNSRVVVVAPNSTVRFNAPMSLGADFMRVGDFARDPLDETHTSTPVIGVLRSSGFSGVAIVNVTIEYGAADMSGLVENGGIPFSAHSQGGFRTARERPSSPIRQPELRTALNGNIV